MIRLATAEDAAALIEIYRPSIEASSVSFETMVPSVTEMRGRIEHCMQEYPWIVDDQQGVLRGYAYAGRYHTRAAYRWAAIVSVYVGADLVRQGIAGRLYRVLFALLEQQGVRQVLAAIAVPNPASQQFHEALGFRQAGVMPQVGYKLGQWQSMGWWQRSLGAGTNSAPTELIAFQEIAMDWQGDLTRVVD
jgi:phosphinothricin acetyltransferase